MNESEYIQAGVCVRIGTLIEFAPRPQHYQRKELSESISGAWENWVEGWVDLFAKEIGVRRSRFTFPEYEEPRTHTEGTTLVVDFPRVRVNEIDTFPLDIRLCIAVCFGDKSSKIWTRVGLPFDKDRPDMHVAEQKLPELVSLFRKLALKSNSWIEDRLPEVVNRHFEGLQLSNHGLLEITAGSIQDQAVCSLAENLAWSDSNAHDLLADRDIRERAISLYEVLSGSDWPRKSTEAKDNEVLWFSTPVAVEAKDGTIEQRETLFLMGAPTGPAQAIGLGYDDSKDGSLPYKSVLKAARWIGRRV